MSKGPSVELPTQDHPPLIAETEPLVGTVIVIGSGDGLVPAPRVVRLAEDFPIGRGPGGLGGAGWQIDDGIVSRRHARISRGPEGWTIADLGSRNGTLVERGLLRDDKMPLADGALIVVGGHVAVFHRLTNSQIRGVEVEQEEPLGPVPTASALLAAVCRRLRVLARTDLPILLGGETGTGKEVFARAVHHVSGRKGPFVPLNCASVPRELFESELFGYRKGSHSQAHDDHPGLVASAEGGTLFLDEIGEMPEPLQAKLLRFLQDKTVLGLGWTRPRRVDVRVVAATIDPFESLREDILGRLGTEPLLLPPLRRRREDIGALCLRFLSLSTTGSARPSGFERDAFVALCLHRFRRNVRELEATVTEAALLAADRGAARIALRDMPAELRADRWSGAAAADQPSGAGEALADTAGRPGRRPRPSREELDRLLREHRGDVPAVARALGRQRELIWRWCKALGLDPHAFE